MITVDFCNYSSSIFRENVSVHCKSSVCISFRAEKLPFILPIINNPQLLSARYNQTSKKKLKSLLSWTLRTGGIIGWNQYSIVLSQFVYLLFGIS